MELLLEARDTHHPTTPKGSVLMKEEHGSKMVGERIT